MKLWMAGYQVMLILATTSLVVAIGENANNLTLAGIIALAAFWVFIWGLLTTMMLAFFAAD